jgi:hypothetical protein
LKEGRKLRLKEGRDEGMKLRLEKGKGYSEGDLTRAWNRGARQGKVDERN